MINAVHDYLPTVVEIPVGVHLQLLHLLHLIQHLMHIELGTEELEAAVRVSLAAKQTRTYKHISCTVRSII